MKNHTRQNLQSNLESRSFRLYNNATFFLITNECFLNLKSFTSTFSRDAHSLQLHRSPSVLRREEVGKMVGHFGEHFSSDCPLTFGPPEAGVVVSSSQSNLC